MQSEEFPDRRTRGLSLWLRVAALILPLGAFFSLFWQESPGAPRAVFKIGAFLWAWPYRMYVHHPLGWFALGVTAVVLAALLIIRRDWKGAVILFIWSLFWGALLANIVGEEWNG